MTKELEKKVDQAIRLLRSIPTDKGDIEVSYSGGKDSDVILELAKMAEIPYRAIYKNTTIDPPGTIRHAKDMGAEIVQPKKTFFEIVRQSGTPSRWSRFCCGYLKEYKILDRAIQGIRRAESSKRAALYKEPEMCRKFSGMGGGNVRIYLPILDWTEEDVAQFISERGIKCHPLYYDEQGNFHVERRLGCIGCPLAAQTKRRMQFAEYPKMLRLWIKNLQIYLDGHKQSKQWNLCNGNAYNKMFFELFCNSQKECDQLLSGGLFPETAVDAKTFLEDYFKIDLTI